MQCSLAAAELVLIINFIHKLYRKKLHEIC